MPLNGTDREKVQQAANDFAKKLKLEKRMEVRLRELFTIITSDFAAFYAATGNVIDANNYSDDFRGIVSSQYRRTVKAFSKNIVKFLKKNKTNNKEKIIRDLRAIAGSTGVSIDDLINSLENSISRDTEAFIRTNVVSSVDSITRTTQKDLDKSVTKARQSLTDELGIDPTRRQIAATASVTFRQASFNRVGTISASTTQNAAEGSKQIERDNFLSTVNSIEAREAGVTPRKPGEVWITMGDSKVRDGSQSRFNHLSADFQEKKNGVFTVSNELLRFPSDRSLGASAGNTTNCRCSAVMVIE